MSVRERRYQLRKEAVGYVRHGHPWVFRDHLSTAASVFADGDRLRLYDGANHIVGHGVYAAEGAIAIRVVRTGERAPDAAWLRGRLAAALARRRDLVARTDGIRLVSGESDGIPAVVADRFGDAIVVTSYATGFDALARYVARSLVAIARGTWPEAPPGASRPSTAELAAVVGPAKHVVVRPAHRRHTPSPPLRVVAGAAMEPLARFSEDNLAFTVDLAGGQKTGAYLDLRGLRRAVAELPLAGKRVLNLFAYTGMTGRVAEAAGATTLVQVDASEPALAFARAHHVGDPARHDFIAADVFTWLPAHRASYDVVIVDPPAMTSRAAQIPKVLASYRKLYRAAAATVAPGGVLIAACCTSRIDRDTFRDTVRKALGAGFAHDRDLVPETDHPAAFPQADYLKVSLWRSRGNAT